jgi:hypothetical protein
MSKKLITDDLFALFESATLTTEHATKIVGGYFCCVKNSTCVGCSGPATQGCNAANGRYCCQNQQTSCVTYA